MTIYIYKAEEVEENNITEIVDTYTGSTNEECEKWASENYGNSDLFSWSYCWSHT